MLLKLSSIFLHFFSLTIITMYFRIFKVWRSLEVSWSLPHLPLLTAFFSRGRNILFQISGGAYSQGGHMPHLFWNRGGICTLCPTAAAHASDNNIVWNWNHPIHFTPGSFRIVSVTKSKMSTTILIIGFRN